MQYEITATVRLLIPHKTDPGLSCVGSTIAFSEDSEVTQPGTGGVDGSGIPNGFHVMPDNTIMSDDAHIYGDGYYVV